MKDRKMMSIMPVIAGTAMTVVGVLFCFETQMGTQALSYIVGIAMIVLGAIYSLIAALSLKTLLTPSIMSASLMISLGIAFISYNLAHIIILLMPIILIVVGGVIFLDAFLLFFIRKGKQRVLFFVIELIMGAVAIALGICTINIDGFRQAASIIFGAALAAIGIYIIVNYFVKRSKREEPEQKSKK